MITDVSALSFAIPATDALGREHVEGQLVAAETALLFHWRFRNRVFRRTGEAMNVISIPYDQVEELLVKTTFRWFKPRLLLEVRDPLLIAGVPGTRVGRAELHLQNAGLAEAKAWIKVVQFHQSEAALQTSMRRISDLRKEE